MQPQTFSLSIAAAIVAAELAWSLPSDRATSPAQAKPAPLVIFTSFEKSPPPVVLESIEREVEAILSPLGMPVKWSEIAGSRLNDAAVQLAVVQFRGACNSSVRLYPSGSRGPLGWTHTADGEVIPFADVDCDRIREMLSAELWRTGPSVGEKVFGRAAGRVVAHELYHVFTGTHDHAAEGLAKPCVTGRDLTAPDFRFHPPELRSLRLALYPARQMLNLIRDHLGVSPAVGKSIYQENACATCHGSRGQGAKGGPALRGIGKSIDFETLARNPAQHDAVNSHNGESCTLAPALLEDYEISDLFSFLAQLQ